MLGEQTRQPQTESKPRKRTRSLWKWLRYAVVALFFLGVGLIAFFFIWNQWIEWRYTRDIKTVTDVRKERVAIVFGAAVYGNGRLSAMLQDRVRTGVDLYQAGKVDKLLMTGDNSSEFYNEPTAMADYANSLGVPYEDIQPDFAGRRTYDSCYRAGAIFELDSAILVTQAFHLPRALFTCQSLGMDVVGVNADRRIYSERSLRWSETRESVAVIAALRDVILRQPPPVLGDPIPIE
jgi:SanA protein